MTKESEVQSAILEWLAYKGFYAVRVNSGKMLATYKGKQRMIHMAPKGTPDILCCIGGHFVGIEVKKDEKGVKAWGKVADKVRRGEPIAESRHRELAQVEQQMAIMEAGGHCMVCASVDDLEHDFKLLKLI